MGCRKFTGTITTILAIVFIFAVNAIAVETTCTFNKDTQELEYSVSDGEAGVTYEIHVYPDGCVDLAGTPPTITGPAGSASVGLISNENNASGHTNVQICKESLCFSFYDLYFVSSSGGSLTQIRSGVPTMTYWGIAALILLISASAFFVIRKKVTA